VGTNPTGRQAVRAERGDPIAGTDDFWGRQCLLEHVLEDTTALRREYRRLTETELPAAAEPDWPVSEVHCFQRIVLDALFEDIWYDHVAGRPAVDHLTADQLREAIAVAESMLADPDRVRELNDRSLGYRSTRA
jgi:hypothetical protein